MSETIRSAFEAGTPKPVHFSKADYESRKELFDSIAASLGYRLAGIRLGQAVFSTKGVTALVVEIEEPSGPDAPLPSNEDALDNGN